MRTLIEKAAIVTMDENENMWPEGYVLFDEESILAVGEGSCSQEADLRIDGKGGILMPGMVNVHSHISMMPFRSMGDDCPDRLRRFLFPLELAAMTPELVYVAARYAVCELLLSGVTSVLDMYYFEDRVASACEEMGIRAWVGETVIGQETCDSKKPYGGLALCEELIRKWQGHYELAEKYQVPYTLHVSEMDYEMRYFEEQYGKTPVAFLQELGVLGKSTIAVHCIHTTDTDIQIFARTGTKVAHCPGSNTKAGKGICPVLDMRGAGVSVGVGTDGPSSGNTLDLFTQLKMIACFQKTKYRDRSAFPAKEIVALGTMEGARVLGAEKEIGSIEVGKRADLVLLETQSANMFPVYNPYSVIVYSANASNVDSVWVQGRQLVRGHQLVEADLTAERRRLWLEMAEFQKQAKQYQNEI